jgi:gas vesicle protein
MKKNNLLAMLIVATCVFGTQMSNLEARPHSTPGEKVDDTIDKVKDTVDKTKDKVNEEVHKTKEKIRDSLDD